MYLTNFSHGYEISIKEFPIIYQLSSYLEKTKYLDPILEFISHNNCIELLDFLQNEKFDFNILNRDKYGNFIYPIDIAAAHGFLDIIEWYDKNHIFKYSRNAIDDACFYGNINVLIWFHQSKYEFRYSEYAIIGAAINGHYHILDFLFDNYNIFVTEKLVNYVIKQNNVKILNWFIRKNFEIPISTQLISQAIYYYCNEIIYWFHDNNYLKEISYNMILISILNFNYKFIFWVFNNKIPINNKIKNSYENLDIEKNYHFVDNLNKLNED